jgi:hypothetical protein
METEFNSNWYSTASTKEQAEFKIWLRSLLQERIVKVTFEKSDGSLREMKATLQSGVAILTESKTGRTKAVNPNVCSVWDTDANAWRSFRYDRIKEINFSV